MTDFNEFMGKYDCYQDGIEEEIVGFFKTDHSEYYEVQNIMMLLKRKLAIMMILPHQRFVRPLKRLIKKNYFMKLLKIGFMKLIQRTINNFKIIFTLIHNAQRRRKHCKS